MNFKYAIFLDLHFSSCQECISFIGKQMENLGIANQNYTKAMLDVIEKYRGVIVLDDGIALAHARPEDGVLNTGLIFVQLNEPIDFYNDDFEKVRFVIGLASTGSNEHIELIQKVANLIEYKIQDQRFESKEALIQFITGVENEN